MAGWGRHATAMAVLCLSCAPAPGGAPVASPSVVRVPDAEPTPDDDRYVVIAGGTPLFATSRDAEPRGQIGSEDDIGGWTMRWVDEDGERVALQAEWDPSGGEHCARQLDGLVGLGMTVWVPKAQRVTVITRGVTLETEGCETLVAYPGVVATPLCERDGVAHYRIGSCPSASCVYRVPSEAVGYEYRPRQPATELAQPAPAEVDGDDRVRVSSCLDQLDETGARRPYSMGRDLLGNETAIVIRRGAKPPEPGHLPSCTDLDSFRRGCAAQPRGGFDHVRYEVPKGSPITWRDGTPAAKADAPHHFRAVPHEVDDRLCWGAVEGSSADNDLELCAASRAVRRVQDAHAVVLQARHDGEPHHALVERDATACYLKTLEAAPDLRGRVRARYRVANGSATLEAVTGTRQRGDEAFAACLAEPLGAHADDAASLELIVELFEPITAG